jgi:predicted nucleic acid-binding Zn ribbon protein
MQPLPLQSILDKVLTDLDLKGKQEKGKICEFWEAGVGSKIARHTSPHSLTSQGKLLINVDSSPWVEELTRFHKEKIKKAMNRLLGQEVIKDIFFRIGKI